MTDLERLRALKADLAKADRRPDRRTRPIPVPETWQADPPSMPWHTRPGEDPRPDLPGTDLWAGLLQLSARDADDPRGVYGRLLGARACGAVLARRGNRWVLAPTMDPAERVSIWATRADWERDAERWLRPKSREIVALLGQLPPRDEGAQG